jgi:tRNA uridine 5-carboxymethylaminomethyl modification enzyme
MQERVRIEVRYEAYIARQKDEVERMRRQEKWALPADFCYEQISGLRSEARESLIRLKPDSIASAQRIAGVSPADISCLMVALRSRATPELLEES